MTDEELIARLRSVHTSADDEAAADRIEVLIAERDDTLGEWDKAIVLADKAAALMNEMDTRRIAAETKLAKAVEALEFYADHDNYDYVYERMPCDCCTDIYKPVERDEGDQARATLAELKGESHE